GEGGLVVVTWHGAKQGPRAWLWAAVFLPTLVLAGLSWFGVERPALRLRHLWARQRGTHAAPRRRSIRMCCAAWLSIAGRASVSFVRPDTSPGAPLLAVHAKVGQEL